MTRPETDSGDTDEWHHNAGRKIGQVLAECGAVAENLRYRDKKPVMSLAIGGTMGSASFARLLVPVDLQNMVGFCLAR